MARLSALCVALCVASAAAFAPSARLARSARRRAPRSALSMSTCLIVQNKGGGHGEIGFHLAKRLAAGGHDVTMLHEGAAKAGVNPFAEYGTLTDAGVDIVWADPSDGTAALPAGATYDVVFDNWSKDAGKAQPFVALAKASKSAHYVFVSSGGMYTPPADYAFPMDEACPTKATGQRAVEELLAAEGLPWTAFRPQYIYGPLTNKRGYIDWYLDRCARGRALPIPEDGSQKVTLTHADDVAAMLEAVVGNAGAVGQVFNCATDDALGYDDVARMCADALGSGEPNIVHFDPNDFDKTAFPFRATNFYVSPSKAKEVLGWKPAHSLGEDIGWYTKQYVDGKMGDADFSDAAHNDDKVLVAFDPVLVDDGEFTV